jgi:hypothetical protein
VKWVRVDTDLFRNRKLAPLAIRNRSAVVTWLGGLLVAGEQETDGFLPAYMLGDARGRASDVHLLVEAGLWTPTGDGWLIHDWEDKQPTRRTSQQISEQARQAAMIRWHGHGNGDGS